MRLPPGKPPTAPKWLSQRAKKKFKEIAALLAESGLLTSLDVDALASYSVSFILWQDAVGAIEKDGQTYRNGELVKVNPAVEIARQAEPALQRWANVLAMTPAARQRMRVELPANDSGDDDPKARFFDRKLG